MNHSNLPNKELQPNGQEPTSKPSSADQLLDLYHLRALERAKTAEKRVEEEIGRIREWREEARKIAGLPTSRSEEGAPPIPDLTEQIEVLEQQISSALSEEQREQLTKKSRERLWRFMRQRRRLEQAIAFLQNKYPKLRDVLSSTPSSNIVAQKIEDMNEDLREYQTRLKELSLRDPESFMASALLTIRRYQQQLPSGIVETPYVEAQKQHIIRCLTQFRLVALVGETGTGKTLLARKIAEQLTGGAKQPTGDAEQPTGGYEFVAGHAFMTREDLFGYLGLSAETTKPEQVPDTINTAIKRYFELNPDSNNLPEEEKETICAQIRRVIERQAGSVRLQTQTVLGPILKAAKEGKIVIIDEFNYIPPQLLAGLNALIEAKPGQTVNFLGEQVEVQPGFGVILTGNITRPELQERYIGRQRLDPALVNRLNSGLIEYSALPQDTDKSFSESILDREAAPGIIPPQRELFQIALTILCDEKGNLLLPENGLTLVWNLARAFSTLQLLFAGRPLPHEVRLKDGQNIVLKTYPISNRTFRSILEGWKNEGARYPLDWYIYDCLIRPAYLIAPQEAAQIFSLLKEREGFFQGPEWAGIQVDNASLSLSGIDTIDTQRDDFKRDLPKPKSFRYFSPQELAEAFFGAKTPFQQLASEEEQKSAESVKEAEKLDQQLSKQEIFVRNLETVSETLDCKSA